jgi:hypothetical protein
MNEPMESNRIVEEGLNPSGSGPEGTHPLQGVEPQSTVATGALTSVTVSSIVTSDQSC